MILFPFLMLSSGFLMFASITHLGQSLSNYYDLVALLMVVGGTIVVGLATLPWEYRKDVWAALRFLFRPEKVLFKSALDEIMETLKSGHSSNNRGSKYLFQKILGEGSELVHLGFSREKIEEILSERVFQAIKRWKKVALALKSLAKYPPAFGLIGTVFGLVNIMKSLSQSADASKLGVEMSIALVATMYGLLVSNFVVNPLAEIILRKSEEEEELAQLAVESVIMLKDRTPILEAIETLNSFVPYEQRHGYEEFISEEGAA